MTEAAPARDPHGSSSEGDPIRTALIESAAAVFAEKGYDGAGVAEIARRAGYTTGAIYGRFKGKAELLLAAIEARSDNELEVLFNEHGFEGNAADILTTVGSHLVTQEPAPESALLLEAFVASRRDAEVRRLLQASLDLRGDRLAALVTAAQANGSIDPALDQEAVVRFCHAVGFGFLLFRAVELDMPDAGPWEDLIARLVEAISSHTDHTAPTTTARGTLQ